MAGFLGEKTPLSLLEAWYRQLLDNIIPRERCLKNFELKVYGEAKWQTNGM